MNYYITPGNKVCKSTLQSATCTQMLSNNPEVELPPAEWRDPGGDLPDSGIEPASHTGRQIL